MPYSSIAPELMSEDAVLEERPGQNWWKRDTCSGQRKIFVRQCDDSRDPSRIIPHPRDAVRVAGQPKLHYGVIGSSNMLLKEPLLRDRLRDEYQVRAIEMEGSGIASATWMSGNAGYLLIRGICDYCVSHKNDIWQGYAAVVAAAYARALIESIPADATHPQSDVQHTKSGERSISIGGNVSGSTIISGDHNTVN